MPVAVEHLRAEIRSSDQQNSGLGDLPTSNCVNMDVDEEDEEEDVDFNPFLREDTPSEVSSGLSSDNERPDDNVVKGASNFTYCQDGATSTLQGIGQQNCNMDSGNKDEEIVVQARTVVEKACGNVVQGQDIAQGKDTTSGLMAGESSGQACNSEDSPKQVIEIGNEDAICRRTRARHSLADYTLEELEEFLQESDDDGDFQNVDDEEEYRKFLAAVLVDGADIAKEGHEDENMDEDEDNDADFELEIEEALESDVDEYVHNDKEWDKKKEGDSHRPETRQRKRLKESDRDKKNLLGQAKNPLRPILPYVPTTQVAQFPSIGWQPKSFSQYSSTFCVADLINGFTANQIGQLYSLMYEHVQLLIQIYSICALDPSRHQVANDVEKMILEMINRREEALASRKTSYPQSCFHPPHLHSSMHLDTNHNVNFSYWTPPIDVPVLSILDVAPLRLAKSYLTDVSATVLRYRQLHVEGVTDKSHFTKEPLFPLPMVASSSERNDEAPEENLRTLPSSVSSHSPGPLQPKKSLAAMLVENTQKQSVALVPKDIAKLAQKFYPLFNVGLFPHKPPVAAVANRVLFTDAEDRLLAMGIMEYNNDWATIQQRYLPCKSKHQIFVRQKNRSSSKAPDNPIKAVRRMKTSPLTPDELAWINEGLKVFKHDWSSVWKFFVPHRDPSLLQRQWRIATGTQKSYKKCEALKMKRRLYEAKRRQLKASVVACPSPRKEVGNEEENNADFIDNEDEAYVHEAFLAEIHPRSSDNIQSNSKDEYRELQMRSGIANEQLSPLKSSHNFSHSSHIGHHASQAIPSKKLPSKLLPRPSKKQMSTLPCQTYKNRGVRLVKLAPGLPPVNLPPSGRVISQAAFKSYYSRSAYSMIGDNTPKKVISCFPQVAKVGGTSLNHEQHKGNDPKTSCLHAERVLADQYAAEENTTESDLQMHPLLFQAAENQFSSYYLPNFDSTVSNTYNFFPVNSVQSENNLLKLQHSLRPVNEVPLSSSTIDFHPLLQRTDNANHHATIVSSGEQQSSSMQTLQGNNSQSFNLYSCITREHMAVNDNLVAVLNSPGHYQKEDEIDLDIHLSSTIGADNPTGGICRSHKRSLESNISNVEHSATNEGMHTKFICHGERVLANPSVQSRTYLVNDDETSKMLHQNNIDSGRCAEGSPYEESIPEIIMEQEELSDSEEESEHVEFEYEEMDDSEGEGLDNEMPIEIQQKDLPTFADAGKDVHAIHDLNLPPHQPVSQTQGSVDKGSKQVHATDTGVTGLHSFSASSSRLKPKSQRINRDQSGKSSRGTLNSRITRSKRRNGENTNLQPLGVQQLHVQTTDVTNTLTSRKRRKRSRLK